MVLVDEELLINFPIRRHHLIPCKDKIPLDENLLLRETVDTTQVSGGEGYGTLLSPPQ